MGMCNSSEAIAAGATAKLILQDGTLHEFSHPAKVWYLRQMHPSIFICNSDDMASHALLDPLPDDEGLRPGHLYFGLPLSRLRRPLQPEEMAALAVKASSALSSSGVRECGGLSGRKSGCSGDIWSRKAASGKVADDGVVGNDGKVTERKRKGGGGGGRGEFRVALSVIPE